MKQFFLTALILLLAFGVCNAKRKRRRNKRFTPADSLRGGLTEGRVCYDVHFYDLKVDFNMADSSISGVNKIAFNVLNATSRLHLDLFANMQIDSIVFKGDTLSYSRQGSAFFVDLPNALSEGQSESLEVFYHGKPIIAKKAPWDGGFVWAEDEKGRPFVGVACERLGGSSWWPCKDHFSDKPDSMSLSFVVPKGLVCVSNGQQMLTKPQVESETKELFQWKVHYPMVNYNATFYLGNFSQITDYYYSGEDSLALNYFVLDYNEQKAKSHFEQVKPMLKIYEDLFGKYPYWKDGYKLVEAPYLGMEHQSAIAYGNQYKSGYLGRQIKGVDFDYVIIHESAHEYWGNNVGMEDLGDMWINEAFATYSEALYVEQMYGKEMMLNYLQDGGTKILNDKPILAPHHVHKEGSNDMYLKGAMMLHVIREQLDDDNLWFSTLRGLQRDFAYQPVGTKVVLAYFESKLGKKLMPVFQHYLNKSKLPMLIVQRMKNKFEYIIHWSDVTEGFEMEVELISKKGNEIVQVNDALKRFTFEKLKSKEPEVRNPFGAFTVHYR